MTNLQEPSKAIASKIFDEVSFENRLIGYELKRRAGPVRVTLYSLVEAVGLLFAPQPRLDFKELVKWIHDVYGDDELASNINDIISTNISGRDKAVKIREIIIHRLIQCKQINDKECV